jgi:hypothetical protein
LLPINHERAMKGESLGLVRLHDQQQTAAL